MAIESWKELVLQSTDIPFSWKNMTEVKNIINIHMALPLPDISWYNVHSHAHTWTSTFSAQSASACMAMYAAYTDTDTISIYLYIVAFVRLQNRWSCRLPILWKSSWSQMHTHTRMYRVRQPAQQINISVFRFYFSIHRHRFSWKVIQFLGPSANTVNVNVKLILIFRSFAASRWQHLIEIGYTINIGIQSESARTVICLFVPAMSARPVRYEVTAIKPANTLNKVIKSAISIWRYGMNVRCFCLQWNKLWLSSEF